MLGAIIGDVAGSSYEIEEMRYYKENKMSRPYEEKIKILDRSIKLFNENSSVTDDSILTFSIYDAIVNGNCSYEKYLKEYGKREIKLYGSRFGKGFVNWLNGNYQGDSYGNGASMRISPVGYLFNDLEEVKKQAKLATIPSHNSTEAIMGAECIATSIYLLRNGYNKEQLKEYINKNYYDLNYDLEILQRTYKFSSKTIETVPHALYIFLISNDFEDSIRKAISIGGDTDTIACIVGSLSEAYYGIDQELKEKVKPYLKDYMLDLVKYDEKIKKHTKI